MYTTVIFDLDGTLLDTLADLHASVNLALRELSFPERTAEEIRRFIGNAPYRRALTRKRKKSASIFSDSTTLFICLTTPYPIRA